MPGPAREDCLSKPALTPWLPPIQFKAAVIVELRLACIPLRKETDNILWYCLGKRGK